MTNKELISWQCHRLEKIRQYLMSLNDRRFDEKRSEYVDFLGDIEDELEAKIHD